MDVEQELDALIEQQAIEILAGHEEQYARWGDPFEAWRAFLFCRRRGRDIPPWVLSYIEKSAKKLATAYMAPPEKRAALVARAFGFTKSGRPRSEYAPERNKELALAVLEKSRTMPLKAAKREVADTNHASFDTVEKAWLASSYPVRRKTPARHK